MGTLLIMCTCKVRWTLMPYCLFCAQNCYYFIVFSLKVNIFRLTKRDWDIFVNKTYFPTVAVHGGWGLLPVLLYIEVPLE